MDSSARVWRTGQPARATYRIGLALVAIGLLLSAGSLASVPLLERLERHAQNTAQSESASADFHARAAAAAAALQSIDIVWDAYSPKIAAVETGLDGAIDARVLLAFRASIARQYNDTAPAEVLDELPPVVSRQPEYAPRRAAFRAAFDDTRRSIRTVFARITQVLRPSRANVDSARASSSAAADAAAVDALFVAEGQLRPRWTAVRDAAVAAARNAAAEAYRAGAEADQAEQKNLWQALIDP